MYIRAATGDSNFNGFYVPWWAEQGNASIEGILAALVLKFGLEPVNAKVTERVEK